MRCRVSMIMAVCITALVIVGSGCKEREEKDDYVEVLRQALRSQREAWESKADELWPLDEVLLEYKRAYGFYRAGKVETALPVVQRLATRPLRFAPDAVLQESTETFCGAYIGGRLIPCLAMLRKIATYNGDHAAKLHEQGRLPDALEVEALNVSLADQLVHSEPTEVTSVLSGFAIWAGAWERIADMLAAAGDEEGSETALKYGTLEAKFVRERIVPLVDRERDESTELEAAMAGKEEAELDRQYVKLRLKYVPELRGLIETWDKEASEAHRFLADLVGTEQAAPRAQ